MMKYGVLNFSYDHFKAFQRQHEEQGQYWVNLGDYMQTLAALNMYQELGISSADIVRIDRDRIRDYQGEPVLVLMNACFYEWCFPLPPSIIPLFVGFQAKEPVIAQNIDALKRYEPIGCRDLKTASLCKKYGIDAIVTGCVTMTFSPRTTTPTEPCVFLAYGSGVGEFPPDAFAQIPPALLSSLQLVYQRTPVYEFPLSPQMMGHLEQQARLLLEDYRSRATLMITPLHHAATPCLSAGIPTVMIRKKGDSRFGYLQKYIPIHLAPDYSQVNWSGQLPDMAALKRKWLVAFKKAYVRLYQGDPLGFQPVPRALQVAALSPASS